MKTRASIIICTHNRAAHLRDTLTAMGRVCLPADLSAELIVVDNASQDRTAQIAAQCCLPNFSLRYLYEPRLGQCHARNFGLREAKGDMIVFTDDDVRPCRNWLINLCTPLLTGKVQAVAGGVTIAPHLERPQSLAGPWMRLASTEAMNSLKPDLIGANMAFCRSVLEKVPRFDTELGPGALGFGDDTLFGRQLVEAGFSTAFAPNASVEHHFEASRLTRPNLLTMAQKQGRSSAYLAHHWQHEAEPNAALFLAKRFLRLACLRQARRNAIRACAEAPWWEMNILRDIAYYAQFLTERSRPRNYEQWGLYKI